VHRLDQINAFKPANLFDFKSLALRIRSKQIDPFKTVTRPEVTGQLLAGADAGNMRQRKPGQVRAGGVVIT
jgi:hypothetical protein